MKLHVVPNMFLSYPPPPSYHPNPPSSAPSRVINGWDTSSHSESFGTSRWKSRTWFRRTGCLMFPHNGEPLLGIWKSMVERWSFPFGLQVRPIFQVACYFWGGSSKPRFTDKHFEWKTQMPFKHFQTDRVRKSQKLRCEMMRMRTPTPKFTHDDTKQ